MKSYSFQHIPWRIYLNPQEPKQKNRKPGKEYHRKEKYTHSLNSLDFKFLGNFFRHTFMDKDCRIGIHANTK